MTLDYNDYEGFMSQFGEHVGQLIDELKNLETAEYTIKATAVEDRGSGRKSDHHIDLDKPTEWKSVWNEAISLAQEYGFEIEETEDNDRLSKVDSFGGRKAELVHENSESVKLFIRYYTTGTLKVWPKFDFKATASTETAEEENDE
ncbi:MAG: hypothetical protein SVV03_02570 [Candidatus Nanohaloarchaea archaeon]|nr:hypothetical protein [Candidatus Nanohaloarchaea archaeon]